MGAMLAMQFLGVMVSSIGAAIAEGDYQKARQLRQQAVDDYGPDVLPVLDRIVAQEVGQSAFAQLTEDPSIRGAQTDVMDELQNVYASEGQTPADMAALQVAQNEVANRAASDMASAQQRLARMGQQGGAALESALAASISGDAQAQAADMALRSQMAARQRALQALTARGSLASGIRGDDLAFGSARAGGQDRISLFNASQRGEAANQNNANAIAMFNARMGVLDRKNAARMGLAADWTQGGDRTRQQFSGVGEGISSAGGAFGELGELPKKKG